MARLGRAQPFKPLIQHYSFVQVQSAVWSAAGSGTAAFIDLALAAGVFAAAGSGDAAFTGSTGTNVIFLRSVQVNQAVNRSAVF